MQEEMDHHGGHGDDKLIDEDQPDDAEALRKKLQKLLDTERILKQQAVNKLAEIMNRKDFNKVNKKEVNKATSAELRKKEKENRKMQQDLTLEKEKFNEMVGR
jgi:hypothetical protein